MVCASFPSRDLTHRLGGTWHGRYGTAPCPVCQTECRNDQNALTLEDGTSVMVLAHCKKTGCNFPDIMAAAGIAPGHWRTPDASAQAERRDKENADRDKRARQAASLWCEAREISGTPAESYLRNRGISCDLPGTLRFHPECWHASTKLLPAMISKVEGTKRFAVHRTYLDGLSKADLTPNKAMLGSVRGGAVRLADCAGPLVVAEGIETALSVASGLLSPCGPVWAALSASGMSGLTLPETAGELVIASDADTAGRAAAFELAERASSIGWRVSTIDPGDGLDFNDILRREAAV